MCKDEKLRSRDSNVPALLDRGQIHQGGNHWGGGQVERQNGELGLDMLNSHIYAVACLHLRQCMLDR